jgi:hypothetical protein
MKRLKYFIESNNISKHKGMDEFIKSIWFITEDEIFDDFIDLHDELDVDMSVTFSLISPSGKEFELMMQPELSPAGKLNKEKIEAYADAGFTPSFKLHIQQNDKTNPRKMHSVAIECISQIEDYTLTDVKRGAKGDDPKGYLVLKFEYDEESESAKSLYHRKSVKLFEPLFSEFKGSDWDVTISKVFLNLKDGKMNIKHSKDGKKLYYITIRKEFQYENFDIVDEIYSVKNIIVGIIEKIYEIDNIIHIDEEVFFDKETKGKPIIKFELYAHEE